MASHSAVEKSIILVRHGSLEAQYDGCYIGSTDVPLSEVGMREAAALGTYLKPSTAGAIYASPLLRARQTAELVAQALPDVPVITEDLLREIDFGTWEGLRFEEICKRDPVGAERWANPDVGFGFPGGETLEAFYRRIGRIKQLLLLSEQEKIALVTHGGVIRSLICNILDVPYQKSLALKIDRGSVSTVSLFQNGQGILTSLNFKPTR